MLLPNFRKNNKLISLIYYLLNVVYNVLKMDDYVSSQIKKYYTSRFAIPDRHGVTFSLTAGFLSFSRSKTDSLFIRSAL